MKAVVPLLSLLILICTGGCESAHNPATSMFQHWIIDSDPNTGMDCCTDILMLGDINGDGKLDVIVGAQNTKNAGLVWYQYPSWEKHPVASGEFTTDGQIADVDGDDHADIIIGSFAEGKGEVVWFGNVSGNGQSEWIRHVVGTGYVHDLVVGDVNGDGKLDIVTCDKKTVVLWIQLTPGHFERHLILERPGEGIALADIDQDGDLDVVSGGSWLENPKVSSKPSPWRSHPIAPKWAPDTRVVVADMNKDGRLDVVLSASEGKGSLSWFESSKDPRADAWVEHPIEKGILEGAHSLQVADFDGDGAPDVLTAEMHTSAKKRVLVYLNKSGAFTPIVLSRSGSHNMRIGDIDGDGDIDLVGKNYAGPGRTIEMWENLASNTSKWDYRSIDDARPKSQNGMMGLVFTDVDRDGFADVVAGSFLYRNPRGKLWEHWTRTELAEDVDVYFAVDVDGDKRSDLVGIARDTILWIEALDEKATSWKARPVGKVGQDGRTQGHVAAKLIPGEKPQLIFTRGKNRLYALEIPADPERRPWSLYLISAEAEEEGLAVGDIDGDGDLDIAAIGADGQHAIWLENSGMLSVNWKMHVVGESQPWMDRVALADINQDGKLDFVGTLERGDGKLADSLYWFEAPADPKQEPWMRHTVAWHRSLNSMDVADLDGDGKPDIVVAEHTDQKRDGAPDNLTTIYLNRKGGRAWAPYVVERGPHSSHLGAQLVDLDNDGVSEIVSIGWGQYRHVHLWKKTVPAHAH